MTRNSLSFLIIYRFITMVIIFTIIMTCWFARADEFTTWHFIH